MKAIGGTRLVIIRGYLLSVFVYCLIGTILGIGLGIVGGYELASFMLNLFTQSPSPLQVPLSAIVPSVIAGLGVPLAAALYPLWNGTRILCTRRWELMALPAGTMPLTAEASSV